MNQSLVRIWFKLTISIFLVLLAIYIIAHVFIPGAEIIKLSKQEITDINLILFGTNQTPLTSNDNSLGTEEIGATENQNNSTINNRTGSSEPSDSIRKATVYNYIFSTRRPLCPQDSIVFKNYFENYNLLQFSVVLPNYPIRVRSYFWLTEGNRWFSKEDSKSKDPICNVIEGSVYLEIIFWAWFGLIASLLYSVSEALRTSEFKIEEVSVHVAKFFYAPLCTVIIYFSISVLTTEGNISIAEFSHGTIVLAFILGFYSGRTIELLHKIKDIILPHGTFTQTNDQQINEVGKYSIEGTLEYDSNLSNYITMTAIKLHSLTDASFVRLTNPDEKGNFSFKKLIEGEYLIRVELKAGTELYVGDESFILNEENPIQKLDITLEKYPLTR